MALPPLLFGKRPGWGPTCKQVSAVVGPAKSPSKPSAETKQKHFLHSPLPAALLEATAVLARVLVYLALSALLPTLPPGALHTYCRSAEQN